MRKFLLLFPALLLLSVVPVLARQATPSFEPTACPFDIPDGEVEGQTLDCGILHVAEDHNDPSSGEIKLAVAVLHSASESPEPDPIIYLAGGPGDSAVPGIDSWVDTPFRDNRDMILFDQRGTGLSEPSLDCPEVAESNDAEATQACHDRLVSAGVNLAVYTTDQSAADVADLQVAMGYDQVNLLGISYGTRLGLVVMRDHPEGIRSVLLDSVYPPQILEDEEYPATITHAFQTLFDGCAADPACNQAYPDLENVMAETVNKLNDNPVTYTTTGADGQQVEDTLTGDSLIDQLFQALYNAESIPYLPKVIYAVSQGDEATLNEIIASDQGNGAAHRRQAVADPGTSEGMDNSVECTEEIPFNDPQKMQAALEAMPQWLQSNTGAYLEGLFPTCQIWGVPQSPPIDKEPVVSDLPTLLLSGEYDPITPFYWAQDTATNLSNGYWFGIPGVGHDTIDNADCPMSMAVDFFNDPTTEPDSSCIDSMTPPQWVVQ